MIYTYTRPAIIAAVLFLLQFTTNAQKRIYVANDDHTDYMWAGNVKDYDSAFAQMLDWWIAYNDFTKTEHPTDTALQSKWNCDGSLWVSRYKKVRSAAQFNKLIDQIKSKQISVPYSPLVCTYGGVPAEAILRGMYNAGELERNYSIKLELASSMENQTLPLGLASLWKGAGAKYCWYGVCDCYTSVPNLTSRQNEVYWYKGLDTNKILLKWYNLVNVPQTGSSLGGYAEVRDYSNAISYLNTKVNTGPYNIVGGFGVGYDDIMTTQDNLVAAASSFNNANSTTKVILSNELDYFKDMETNYGSSLPTQTQTFGNEWDLSCASMAEVSGHVKRMVEKLRSAEAMASIVTNYMPTFTNDLDSLKKEAWMALGLFWEHDFGFAGPSISLDERNAYQRKLDTTITLYVNQLYNLSLTNLSNLITSDDPLTQRFFAFNPLGWKRTNYADYVYSGSTNIHVKDVVTALDVPSQIITRNGTQYLRVLADSIPSVGYKVYEIQPGTGTSFPNAGTNGGNIIESDSFKVTYTNAGVLTSVIDKNHSRELVQSGKFLNDLGSGSATTGSITSIENGPVSISVLLTSTAPVSHKTRITLFKNVARIEIDNQITQNFGDTKTWNYGFNITGPTVWHEETGAVIKAKLTSNGGHYATQNARYDWSTLNHFASVNESNFGVSISNQDCYFMKIGNSTESTLDEGATSSQLKILAGGQIDNLGMPDQGGDAVFNQRFAITTHTGFSATAEMKKALEHQDSMVCGAVYNPVNFLLPNQYSFISNSNPNSMIWAVKPTEIFNGDSRGILTRVWNLSDVDATQDINFNLKINDAYLTTHVETDISKFTSIPANVQYNLPLSLGHNEMKSFRTKMYVIPLAIKTAVELSGNKVQESNVLNWKIITGGDIGTFELERSADAQHFTKIATIAATSDLVTSYAYTDKGLNIAIPFYYRLHVINKNGSLSYSNIILIKAASEAYNIILYPNPIKDILKANFVLEKQTRCQVLIYNTAGEMVKTVASPLFERGNNYYSLSIKDLPAGDYIFTIIAGDKKYVKNFIKE
ncbi:T9SS type A sorting domain-containing protein [Ferruginibacter sp.]